MGDDEVEAPTQNYALCVDYFANHLRIISRIIKELGYVAPM